MWGEVDLDKDACLFLRPFRMVTFSIRGVLNLN